MKPWIILFAALCLTRAFSQETHLTADGLAAISGTNAASGGGSDTAFVTSVTSLDGSFTTANTNGVQIVVGGSPITVTQLGRYIMTSDTGETLPVTLRDQSCNVLATASVSSSGTVHTFKFVSITPVVLSAGGTYFVFCGFDGGGDHWSNNGTAIVTSGAATPTSASLDSGSCTSHGGQAFYPINFMYH